MEAFNRFSKVRNQNWLIIDKDKEMTLIVVYGDNERKATFKLSDLQKGL